MKRLLRTFRRSPGFFAVVVITLAVGIGANTAIFSVVRGILLRPLPYSEPDRLVAVAGRAPFGLGPFSVLDYLDTREQATHLQRTAAWASGDANLTGVDTAERITVGYVTPDLFAVLGVAAARGRTFAAEEDQPGKDHVAVLTHALWKRRFNQDPAVVGKPILLDNESFTVVGILPASFTFKETFDAYLPLGFTPEMREAKARDQHFLWTVGRMQAGVSVEALNQQLAVIGARTRAAYPQIYNQASGWHPEATPLLDDQVSDVRSSLFLLAAAAALVLLIVCGNVAGLLLARAGTRQRELSVRAALGATRLRLLAELLGESLVLSAAGGALGVAVAVWGTDVLLSLAPEGLPRSGEVRIDALVLVFSVAVTAVTGAIFGLVPAWMASRVDLHDALRAGGRAASSGTHPRRVRRALVVAETALALVLATAAALVTRSFERVMSVDPGFRTDGVISLRVTLPVPSGDDPPANAERRARWFAEAVDRIEALPGVSHAGAISNLPLRDGLSDRIIDLEGLPLAAGDERPSAQFRRVTPGYLETMEIPVVEGRTLGRDDGADAPPVAVVSRSFVHQYFPSGAVGKRFRLSSPQGPWTTIVGVVGDVRDAGLDKPTFPEMYLPLAQSRANSMAIVARGTLPMGDLAASVRAELARFDAQQPFYDLLPMSARVGEAVEQRRFVLVLFELFAVLALGLAALGLYGVLAHAVTDRQREIGVRVALGATRANVVGLVAREGGALVGIGVALGLAGGLAGSRLLQGLLYDISPTDPLALAGAVLLLALAGGIAVWLPARRALRVDPMTALRDE